MPHPWMYAVRMSEVMVFCSGSYVVSLLLASVAGWAGQQGSLGVRSSDIPFDGPKYAAEMHRLGEQKRRSLDALGAVTSGYRIVDGVILMEGDDSLILGGNPWPIANRTAWRLAPEMQSFRVEQVAYLPPAMSGSIVASPTNPTVEVPLGFSFPIGDGAYATAWVSAHGCISFGKPTQWTNGWATSEIRAILDPLPRLCPEFSDMALHTHFRTEPGRAVFWWEGGPVGTSQAVLTSSGEAYFYYAAPPQRASIMAVTSAEPWWTSGRVVAQASTPIGPVKLEQMADTNLLTVRVESANTAAITVVSLDLNSAPGGELVGVMAYREGASWKFTASDEFRGWDPFVHAAAGAVVLRTPVPADKLAAPFAVRVGITAPGGSYSAVLSLPVLAPVREFATDFTELPITGLRMPLMNAYNTSRADFVGAGSRISECGSGACDAIAVYTTFPNGAPSISSGANMQANGIGRGDSLSRPFVPNYMLIGGEYLAGRDDSAILSHEFGHGWLYSFSIIENGLKTHSLNPDSVHPAAYAHTPVAFPQTPGALESSTMGGGVWRANPDGSFTSVGERTLVGYSWLELYLMGLADPSEVPELFYIRNTDPPQPINYTPSSGVRVTGTKVPVNISQVIAAEGPRVPSYATSKKDFTVQFVLLHRPGEAITAEQISGLHDQRFKWKAKWELAVGNRARLRTSVVPAPVSNGAAVRLDVYSGNNQVTLSGFYLNYPLVAVATDASGRRVADANLTWTVTRGEAVLHPSGTKTDEVGRAVAQVEMRSPVAEITVSVASGPRAVFKAYTGPLVSRVVSGDRQAAVVGRSLPQPITVEVRDHAGAPAAGVPVRFYGNAAGLTASAVTDASGLASTRATPTAPGPIVIFVDLPNESVLTITATGIQATASVPLLTTNGASFSCCNAVAPGEVITVWGTGFGAPDLTVASYDAQNNLPREVGGTRVLFDGVPGPMIFSAAGQVSTLVPYGVAGTTRIQVEQNGRIVNDGVAAVVPSTPGLFCYEGGKGQAVAVNTYADGSAAFNGRDVPAQRGSWLTFFITGEGALAPTWTDGRLPVYPNNPKPAQPVRVFLGDVESTCPDNWTGLIYAGVTQVNACVPAGAPVGPAVPLRVVVGDGQSQPEVTVSVR